MNADLFLKAQELHYEIALKEIKNGQKISHWMWFIFPQIIGLGNSEMALKYALRNLGEAEAYLQHPILGLRLVEICTALLAHKDRTAESILGYPDDLKLRSSMTLFSEVAGASDVFMDVLNLFYDGNRDEKTLKILRA
jgi:uncharacterized protein (DUF1810 family)